MIPSQEENLMTIDQVLLSWTAVLHIVVTGNIAPEEYCLLLGWNADGVKLSVAERVKDCTGVVIKSTESARHLASEWKKKIGEMTEHA